jgi:hypothetical protein
MSSAAEQANSAQENATIALPPDAEFTRIRAEGIGFSHFTT